MNHGNVAIIAVYLLFTGIALSNSSAYSSDEIGFREAYDDYIEVLQKNARNGDKDAVVAAAKIVFDAGFKTFGSESKNTSLLAKNYADALIAANKKKEAAAVFKEALVYYKAAFGERSQEVKAIFLELLGLVASIPEDNSGILEEAMQLFISTLDPLEQKYSFLIAEFYTQLADSYIRYKLYDRAILELEKARDIHIRAFSDADKWVVATEDRIYWLKNLNGKDWLNLEDVRYTYKTMGNSLNKEEYAYLIKNYFLELKNNLYPRTAVDVLKEEKVTIEEIYKDHKIGLVYAYIELAKSWAIGDVDSRAYLRKAIALGRKVFGPKSFEFGKMQSRVAYAKKNEGLHQEAASHAEEAIDILSRLPPSKKTNEELAYANYILSEIYSSRKSLMAPTN